MNNNAKIVRSEVAVLNQLIAIQNLMYIFPDVSKKCEFIVGALKGVPGICMCSIYLTEYDKHFGDKVEFTKEITLRLNSSSSKHNFDRFKLDDNSEIIFYTLQTVESLYGFAILKIDNSEEFEKFLPSVMNLINIIVINLEIDEQNKKIVQYQDHLEEVLQERTKELKNEVESHKLALKELKESELKYRQLHESMTDAYIEINMSGRIVNVNRAFCEMIGYSETELKKLKFTDLTPEKWFNFEQDIINNQILVYGYSQIYEKEYINKCGVIFPIELRTYLLKDENNNPSGMWAIIRDISERKSNQLKIIESEQRLKEIISNTSAGYFYIDKDGYYKDVNHSWLKLHKYNDTNEIIGKHYSVNQVDKDRSEADEIFKEMISGKQIPSGEFTRLCKDGSIGYHRFSAHPVIFMDEVVGIEGFIIDKTEQKHIELELLESEHRFKEAFEYSAIGMALISNDLKLMKVNRQIVKILGYSEEELYSKKMEELIHKDDLYTDTKQKNDLFEGKINTYSTEKRLSNKSGNYFWSLLAYSLAKDRTGKPLHLIVQIEDITERKKAQEIILQHSKMLEDINAAKDKFFSIIAHDLKAPFSGFLGITKLMANNISDFSLEDLQILSIKMSESANNLYKLLDNLLEWSRVQRGVFEYTPEKCSLLQIIKQNIELIKENAHQKEIEILNNISKDIFISVDVSILNTILRNLLSNALKFTNRGGKISVGISNNNSKNRQINNKNVQIYIKDSGIGMSNALLNRLFKIEEDVLRKGTENEPSTGLGLILCKEFVEMNGGKIWVESEEGVGSTFYFTLKKI